MAKSHRLTHTAFLTLSRMGKRSHLIHARVGPGGTELAVDMVENIIAHLGSSTGSAAAKLKEILPMIKALKSKLA